MSISVPLIFDKDVETFGSFQNLSNIINAVNTELEDNYDSNAAETVSRTIYVDASGNDITGDGTVLLPYLTIGKAWSTIAKSIDAGVTITVTVGAGTFTINDNDLAILSSILGAGILITEGVLALSDTGFTMGSAETLDPFTYSVSGGNTATWTTDQWKYYFLKSGSSYYPLTNNTTTTISGTGSVTGTEIYENTTTINLVNTNTSFVVTSIYRVTFRRAKIVVTSNISFSGKFLYFINCNFLSTNKVITLRDINNVIGSTFNTTKLILSVNDVAITNSYLYTSENLPNITIQNKESTLQNVVLENSFTEHGSCIYVDNGGCLITKATAINYIKFINSPGPIRYSRSADVIDKFNSTYDKIILVNSDHLFQNYSSAVIDNNSPVKVLCKYSNIIGTPIISWFGSSMYEFVNLSTGRNIQIAGLIYPEYSTDSSIGLINNAITDISIGHILQNKSIKIDYTLSRSTNGFRQGSFNILSDGSTLYMSPDTSTNFISSPVNYVNSSAIAFSAIRDASIIKLRATVDASGGNVSLAYNATRVMKTPIIL